VLFILATTEPHKIPETVRSRCQRFDFRRISQADIERKLQRIVDAESAQVEAGVLGEIARRATGGLRDAESLLDQALSAAPRERTLAVSDLVSILGGIPREVRDTILLEAHAGNMAAVLGAVGSIVDAGADPAELLRDLYSDLRDRAVRAAVQPEDPRVHSAPGSEPAPGVEWCLAAAELVARHQRLAATSRAARSALDLCLLAITRLGDVQDLEGLVARLERLGGAPAPDVRRSEAAPESRRSETAPESRRSETAPESRRSETLPVVVSPPHSSSPQSLGIPTKPIVASQKPAAPPPARRPGAPAKGLAKFLPPSAASRAPEPAPPQEAPPSRSEEGSVPSGSAPRESTPREWGPGPDGGLGNTASPTENASQAPSVPARPTENQKENRALSSEEMHRIRALPAVDGLLSEFRGRIEHIKLAQPGNWPNR